MIDFVFWLKTGEKKYDSKIKVKLETKFETYRCECYGFTNNKTRYIFFYFFLVDIWEIFHILFYRQPLCFKRKHFIYSATLYL